MKWKKKPPWGYFHQSDKMSPALLFILNIQGLLTICQILATELLSIRASDFGKLNSILCVKSGSYCLGRAHSQKESERGAWGAGFKVVLAPCTHPPREWVPPTRWKLCAPCPVRVLALWLRQGLTLEFLQTVDSVNRDLFQIFFYETEERCS